MIGTALAVGGFDFDGDGKMSAFEQAVEFKFLHDVVMTDRAEDKLAAAGLDKNALWWLSEILELQHRRRTFSNLQAAYRGLISALQGF